MEDAEQGSEVRERDGEATLWQRMSLKFIVGKDVQARRGIVKRTKGHIGRRVSETGSVD